MTSDSTLSRRGLLRLTAGAAGVATLPNLLTASPASAYVDELVAPALAPDILADDVFPIGLFWPPPRNQTTELRYEQIANCGINVVAGGNDMHNMPANTKMLQMAAHAGLRALPIDNRITHATPCPGWENAVRQTVAEYQAYPAFAGFLVHDEPNPIHYPRLRMITDLLAATAPDKLGFINLVPYYTTPQDGEYQEFLRRYVSQIDPSVVSYDHYPLLTDNSIRPTFFSNHRRIREAGLRSGRPTWVYVNTVQHGSMKQPTQAELAWQVNVALAYGCKGIQYFTYWTPVERPDHFFYEALITKQGCPSKVYGWAWELNRCHLQPVGRELKHLVSRAAVHANEATLPFGTERFAAAGSDVLASTSGSAVVLGEFRSEPIDNTRWLFVANRSYTATANARLALKPEVSSVETFVATSASYQPTPLVGRAFDVSVPPGGGKLFRLPLTPPT